MENKAGENGREQPRTDAAVRGTEDPYLLLERENEFLRGQVSVKDSQIEALLDLARHPFWGEDRRPDHRDVSFSLPSPLSRTNAASRAARNSSMLTTSASLNTSPTRM
jgi:hypothetical protein